MAQHQSTSDFLAALTSTFGSESFTSAAARTHGFDLERIQRLSRQGHVHRLRRGAYCLDVANLQRLMIAQVCADALESGVKPIIGGSAAADAWGMYAGCAHPVVWVPRNSRTRRGKRCGITIREGQIRESQQAVMGDAIYTSPMRTAIDVGCERLEPWEIVWLLILGMRREMEWRVTGSVLERLGSGVISTHLNCEQQRENLIHELAMAVEHHHGRGIRRVRGLIHVADPRIESALEAASLLEFHQHRILIPQLQVRVSGASGRRYRVDFHWGTVIGEADGALKYSSPESLWAEKRRQEDLERAGYIVVRWSWAEMLYEPSAVIARIESALSRPRGKFATEG